MGRNNDLDNISKKDIFDLRFKYQKVIDQTNKSCFYVYIALATLLATYVLKNNFQNHSDIFILIIGSVLSFFSLGWLLKIRSWNRLLDIDIKYLELKYEEAKEYYGFVNQELDKIRIIKKEYSKILPNYADDLLPVFLLIIAIAITFVGIIMTFIING